MMSDMFLDYRKTPRVKELVKVMIGGRSYDIFVTHQDRKIIELETAIDGVSYKVNDELVRLILAVIMYGFHP